MHIHSAAGRVIMMSNEMRLVAGAFAVPNIEGSKSISHLERSPRKKKTIAKKDADAQPRGSMVLEYLPTLTPKVI